MGKTYSVEKFWRDELKKNPDVCAGQVLEKLCRHPNKKKTKAHQTKTYNSTSNPVYWRNPLGEEHEKSSRARLIRKAGVGILRARLKNEARQIVKDSMNEE